MQVFIKTLTGKTITLECQATDLVEDIKSQLNVEDAQLVLSGVALQSGSLQDYAVMDNAVIDLFEIDDGGKKKKRKKKNFVSKKRVPHTRKKEKLKLLKLFKVGKDGSVDYAREMCPHCKGSFMAKHKDGRKYCGNCHHTVFGNKK